MFGHEPRRCSLACVGDSAAGLLDFDGSIGRDDGGVEAERATTVLSHELMPQVSELKGFSLHIPALALLLSVLGNVLLKRLVCQ